MLPSLSITKLGVCITLLAAYTFLVVMLTGRHGYHKTAKQTPQQHSDSYITDCITKRILGRIPDDMVTELIDDWKIGDSAESHQQRQASFRQIFNQREWGYMFDTDYKGIQASGHHATLRHAQEAIAGLHQIIGDFKLQMGVSRVRLLDIPCGDMAWMSSFLMTRDDVDYTGMDIVPELISNHSESFKKYPWRFIHQDIVEQPLNKSYDIIFCRVMLQHIHTPDIHRILKRFSDSGSRYLLTTSFCTVENNANLPNINGRFRPVNLEIPPFSLAPPKCMFRDSEFDDLSDYKLHFLGLWDLPLRKIRNCNEKASFILIGANVTIYSCTKWDYSLL